MSTVPSSTPWCPATEERSNYIPPLSQAQVSPRTTASQKCQSEVQQPSTITSQLPVGASTPLLNAKWRRWKWMTSTMGLSGSIMKIMLQRTWVLCAALIYQGKKAMLLPVHPCSLSQSCSFRCYLPVHTRADNKKPGKAVEKGMCFIRLSEVSQEKRKTSALFVPLCGYLQFNII